MATDCGSAIALLKLVPRRNKTISSSAAQQVFAEMFDTGKAPAAIVRERGLAQVSDTGAIEEFCDEVITANPDETQQGQGEPSSPARFLRIS